MCRGCWLRTGRCEMWTIGATLLIPIVLGTLSALMAFAVLHVIKPWKVALLIVGLWVPAYLFFAFWIAFGMGFARIGDGDGTSESSVYFMAFGWPFLITASIPIGGIIAYRFYRRKM